MKQIWRAGKVAGVIRAGAEYLRPSPHSARSLYGHLPKSCTQKLDPTTNRWFYDFLGSFLPLQGSLWCCPVIYVVTHPVRVREALNEIKVHSFATFFIGGFPYTFYHCWSYIRIVNRGTAMLSARDVSNDSGSHWNESAHNAQISCRQRYDKQATKVRGPEQSRQNLPNFHVATWSGL